MSVRVTVNQYCLEIWLGYFEFFDLPFLRFLRFFRFFEVFEAFEVVAFFIYFEVFEFCYVLCCCSGFVLFLGF